MYRLVLTSPYYSEYHRQRWQEAWARLLVPLVLWLCVLVSLRYGYYGNSRMVLGPSSSRLIKASSIFVEKVEVRDYERKGAVLYTFSEKPQLSSETNWSMSDFMIVGSYNRQGFSLWLNRGSGIRLQMKTQSRNLNRIKVMVMKGERNIELLDPSIPYDFSLEESLESKEIEYMIKEDDKYYISVVNANPRSIIMTLTANISSRVYDLTEAKNMCSASKGSCKVNLSFLNVNYVMLTTPSNDKFMDWYMELSFVARKYIYISILGFVAVILILIWTYIGVYDFHQDVFRAEGTLVRDVTETAPLIPGKPVEPEYGTIGKDDEEPVSSSSSENIYDANLCAICYDEQRNCFFIPCGHSVTCHDCAQRIMEEDIRVCPICRRLIHRVRRLFVS